MGNVFVTGLDECIKGVLNKFAKRSGKHLVRQIRIEQYCVNWVA